jgi:bifunctional UDP-N-acetylglucosamine pyrophosphorylase/glucosamine-1-phosphate N-acetyltransferase
VVLAAGKGTRMKSALPKVLHAAGGIPLIEHVLRTTDTLSASSTVIVVGHGAEAVRSVTAGRRSIRFVTQEPQLGTGHALLQAEPALRDADGTVILLSGDVPLLTPGILRALVDRHLGAKAAATVLTAMAGDPAGYGRIVRRDGVISAIVEHEDASPEQRQIREINSGIYAFDLEPLFAALRQIGAGNAQREYYLPDLVRMYRERGLAVETVTLDHPEEILGVNTRNELAEAAAVLRRRVNAALMASGVTLIDPATAYIDAEVVIGPDTIIHPNVYLQGRTIIGSGCEIQCGVRIVNSTLGNNVSVNRYCVMRDSRLDDGADVGPFAHLRPESHLAEDAHVGAFVELKKTSVGRGSKAGHLAYLGDSKIGEKVNIGAGTITCNYDGRKKHQTTIEDGAFIGSDSQLIAPVTIGKGAYVAAGSSITENVPAGSLAIARGTQVNKEGWVAKNAERKATP